MQLLSLLRSSSPAAMQFAGDQPKWHRIYYLLAAFDICALLASLFLNHRIMQIYTESVATNQMWVGIWHQASELGELAANINAPGNDVFQSGEPAREASKLSRASVEFKDGMSDLIQRLRSMPEGVPLNAISEDLKTVRSATAQMTRDAKLTFAFFSAGRVDRATTYMASMDRQLSIVNSTLVRLRGRIGELQNASFESQTAAAAALQKSEYAMAGVITLMILGATLYGRMIAAQVFQVAAFKEVYRDELEKRVIARTADLQSANAARAELLKLLMSAQEDERRRIARDLHDGVGQALTYLVVNLRRLEGSTGSQAAEAQVGQLREVTADTLEDVRRIARGLRPSLLDDLGLYPAIERLIQEFSASHGTPVEVNSEIVNEQRLPDTIETALYRIVQEALTNIAKHAGATQVCISIRQESQQVRVSVSDNGTGFLAPTRGAPPQSASMGLSSIRERAVILGGVVAIESSPGKGTAIQVTLPITGTQGGERSGDIDPTRQA